MSFIDRYAAATWTPPFPQPLPSDATAYSQCVPIWKMAQRRARRELNLWLQGQSGLRRERIEPARRLLWIYKGMPQVGDSLMDLAARVLLIGRVDSVDLLIDAHLVPLYAADQVFDRVSHDPAQLAPAESYDLVLLHSASSHSLQDKLHSFRHQPFVHMHGIYTGPEFNRTLFGFYRLAQLLGIKPVTDELAHRTRPVMWSSAVDIAAIDALGLPSDSVAMSVGGVHDWRTYTRWDDVLTLLRAAGWQRPILLIGANNGAALRDRLMVSHGFDDQVIDCVGRHTLGQTHALLQRCRLALCADGGLLHLAHAADVPAVGLFAGIINPAFRLTTANRTRALYGAQRVDDIAPQDVAAAVLEQDQLVSA